MRNQYRANTDRYSPNWGSNDRVSGYNDRNQNNNDWNQNNNDWNQNNDDRNQNYDERNQNFDAKFNSKVPSYESYVRMLIYRKFHIIAVV